MTYANVPTVKWKVRRLFFPVNVFSFVLVTAQSVGMYRCLLVGGLCFGKFGFQLCFARFLERVDFKGTGFCKDFSMNVFDLTHAIARICVAIV